MKRRLFEGLTTHEWSQRLGVNCKRIQYCLRRYGHLQHAQQHKVRRDSRTVLVN